jgi:hypothetical protein
LLALPSRPLLFLPLEDCWLSRCANGSVKL